MKVTIRLANLFVSLMEMRDLVNQIPHFHDYNFVINGKSFTVSQKDRRCDQIKFEFTKKGEELRLYPCCILFDTVRNLATIYSYVKLVDGRYPFYKIPYKDLDDVVMLSLSKSNQDIDLYGLEAECIDALIKYLKEEYL